LKGFQVVEHTFHLFDIFGLHDFGGGGEHEKTENEASGQGGGNGQPPAPIERKIAQPPGLCMLPVEFDAGPEFLVEIGTDGRGLPGGKDRFEVLL